ncbi:hypothetical protein HKX48_008271 [Thoreauomyces humboldtii]|nr:hypothetical protein HKX48_008271 [Thoreauomyces humboldtii]
MSGINSGTASGLRTLDSTVFQAPLVSGDMASYDNSARLLGFASVQADAIQGSALHNENGELLVNQVEGTAPIHAETVGGNCVVSLSIDGKTLKADEGRLEVIDPTFEAPLEYDVTNRSASLIHDASLGVFPSGQLSVNYTNIPKIQTVAPINNGDDGIELLYDPTRFTLKDGQLTLMTQLSTVGNVATNDILFPAPFTSTVSQMASETTINLALGKGLEIDDDGNLKTNVGEVIKTLGALSDGGLASIGAAEALSYGFSTLGGLTGDVPDNSVTVLRLKTGDDFNQSSGTLVMASQGAGNIPFFGALDGLQTGSLTFNETSSTVTTGHVSLASNYKPTPDEAVTAAYVGQYIQGAEGGGITVNPEEAGHRTLAVHTDSTLAVNPETQNLGVSVEALVDGVTVVATEGKISSGLTFTTPLIREESAVVFQPTMEGALTYIEGILVENEVGAITRNIAVEDTTEALIMIDNVIRFDSSKVTPELRSQNAQILVETEGTTVTLTGNLEVQDTSEALTLTDNVIRFDASKVTPELRSQNAQILVETEGTSVTLTGNVEVQDTSNALTINENLIKLDLSQAVDGSTTFFRNGELGADSYNFGEDFQVDHQSSGQNAVNLALTTDEDLTFTQAEGKLSSNLTADAVTIKKTGSTFSGAYTRSTHISISEEAVISTDLLPYSAGSHITIQDNVIATDLTPYSGGEHILISDGTINCTLPQISGGPGISVQDGVVTNTLSVSLGAGILVTGSAETGYIISAQGLEETNDDSEDEKNDDDDILKTTPDSSVVKSTGPLPTVFPVPPIPIPLPVPVPVPVPIAPAVIALPEILGSLGALGWWGTVVGYQRDRKQAQNADGTPATNPDGSPKYVIGPDGNWVYPPGSNVATVSSKDNLSTRFLFDVPADYAGILSEWGTQAMILSMSWDSENMITRPWAHGLIDPLTVRVGTLETFYPNGGYGNGLVLSSSRILDVSPVYAKSADVASALGAAIAGCQPLSSILTALSASTPTIGSLTITSSLLGSPAATFSATSTTSLGFSGALTVSQATILQATTVKGTLLLQAGVASSSTTTGSAVITGGLGISGSIYAGGSIVAPTGTFTSATVLSAPVNGSDIVNKTYSDGQAATLSSATTTLAGRVTTTEGAISTFQGKQTTDESNTASLQTSSSSMATAASALTTRVSTAEGNLTALQARATADESSITALQTRATNDETTISGHTSSITALQSRATTDEATVTALTTRVSTVEMGKQPLASNLTSLSSAAPSLPSLSVAGSFIQTTTIVNNGTTPASGTVSAFAYTSLSAPTLTASNTGVVTPIASTLYISGSPVAGSNLAITQAATSSVGSLAITGGVDSTSLTPRSLQVSGGGGLTGSLFVGGNVSALDPILSTHLTSKNYVDFQQASPTILGNNNDLRVGLRRVIPDGQSLQELSATGTYTFATFPYANGSYTVSLSTAANGAYNPWKALATFSIWDPYGYMSAANYSSGVYSGTSASTLVGGVTYLGDWMQVQLPAAVVVHSYSVRPRSSGNAAGAPTKWVLAGSSDGTTWSLIHSVPLTSFAGVIKSQRFVTGSTTPYLNL